MQYSAKGRGNNALQRVVFIAQFSESFTDEDFRNFDNASRDWREKLPKRSVANGMVVNPATLKIASQDNQIVGLSYEALMKDGNVDFGLRFTENQILFMDGNYTQWASVWPRAQEYLEKAIGLVPETNSVLSYAVEYTDLFRAHAGEYSEFQASGFLRKDSPYIPKHVFNGNENWHFHTGYFETYENPNPYRILTGIRANLTDNDEEKSRDLSIVLMHQLMSDREPWGSVKEIPASVRDRGIGNFEFLHKIDKDVLRQILNESMAKEIGLRK